MENISNNFALDSDDRGRRNFNPTKITYIPIKQLVWDENQARSYTGSKTVTKADIIREWDPVEIEKERDKKTGGMDMDFLKLCKSVYTEGRVKEPIQVFHKPGEYLDGNKELPLFQVKAGERRTRATVITEIAHDMPCIILDNERDAFEVSISSNEARKNLHPVDRGFAFYNALEKGLYKSQKEICDKHGLSKQLMCELIAYGEIPKEIRAKITQDNLRGRRFLRKLKTAIKDVNKLNLAVVEKEETLTIELTKIYNDEIEILKGGVGENPPTTTGLHKNKTVLQFTKPTGGGSVSILKRNYSGLCEEDKDELLKLIEIVKTELIN